MKKITLISLATFLVLLFSTTVGYGQAVPNTFDGSYCPGPGVSGDEYLGTLTTGVISTATGTCNIKQVWAKVDTGLGNIRLGFKIGNSGTALFRLYIDTNNSSSSGLITDTFGGTSIPAGGAEYVLQINSNSGDTKLFQATSTTTISEITNTLGLGGLNGNSTGCVGNDGQFLEFYIPFSSIGFNLCDSSQPGKINIARYAAVAGGNANSNLCSNAALDFSVSLSGTVASNQTICEGGSISALNLTITGGGTNTVTTWEKSTDGVTYIGISGTATLTTYTPGTLTAGTHYFRAQIENLAICTNSFASSPAIITVNTKPAAPTVSKTPPTCSAAGFTTITNYSASNTYT
ncbi:MAG: hypothetical protein WA143_07930, partial [Lutibacter sp.]